MRTASPAATTARARARSVRRVVATTDVHSSLDRAGILVRSLRGLRAVGALIVDCGDFFEGTGYYVLGRGRAEIALLRGLYDVAAPGNHGYQHHVTHPGLRAITVCVNVTDHAGAPVWQPLTLAEVQGSTTAVTGVLGVEAFTSIPSAERCGHQALDPVAALHNLHNRYRGTVDSWIVLSHSGFSHDLLLAQACPFIDVIFAGHCHSPGHGPQAVGGAVVVKGAELAVGYSAAWPDGTRWHAETGEFSDDTERTPGGLPADVDQALAQVTKMSARLAQSLGPVRPRFANRTPDRHELLTRLAEAATAMTGADAALFNLTCLREARLGSMLTAGDLMALEPFGNALTCIRTEDIGAVSAQLTLQAGALVSAPRPLPPPGRSLTVVTTDYLTSAYLAASAVPASRGAPARLLRDLLAGILLDTSRPPGPHRELP